MLFFESPVLHLQSGHLFSESIQCFLQFFFELVLKRFFCLLQQLSFLCFPILFDTSNGTGEPLGPALELSDLALDLFSQRRLFDLLEGNVLVFEQAFVQVVLLLVLFLIEEGLFRT